MVLYHNAELVNPSKARPRRNAHARPEEPATGLKKGGSPLPIPFLRLKVILIGFGSHSFELCSGNGVADRIAGTYDR